jgi:hypothetical protein
MIFTRSMRPLALTLRKSVARRTFVRVGGHDYFALRLPFERFGDRLPRRFRLTTTSVCPCFHIIVNRVKGTDVAVPLKRLPGVHLY